MDASSSTQQYFRISCLACRNAHRKCSRELPTCTRCLEKKLECCYQLPKKRSRPNSTTNQQLTQQEEVTLPIAKYIRVSPEAIVQDVTASLHASATSNYLPIDAIEKVLNHIVPEKKEYVPYGVPLYNLLPEKEFQSRVNRAHWLATVALTLLKTPTSLPESYDGFCKEIEHRMAKCNPIIADLSFIKDMSQKCSRIQLSESAQAMFSKAKETVLSPDIYPHIASNASLALSCAVLALFSIQRHSNSNESMLFNSAVKVFIKRSGKVLDLDLSLFTGSNRAEMERVKWTTQLAMVSFFSVKMLLQFNQDPYQMTFDDLYDLMELVHKLCSSTSKLLQPSVTYPDASFQMIKHILKQKQGLDRLLSLLEPIEVLISDGSWLNGIVHETETKIWHTGFIAIPLYAIIIELVNYEHSMEVCKQLKELQYKYANLLARQYTEEHDLFVNNGIGLSRLYLLASHTHIGYCHELLSSSSVTVQDLSELLAYLHSDLHFVQAMRDTYALPAFSETAEQLKHQISVLVSRIQEMYTAQYIPAQQEFAPDLTTDSALIDGLQQQTAPTELLDLDSVDFDAYNEFNLDTLDSI
jgi:hypothetical protein